MPIVATVFEGLNQTSALTLNIYRHDDTMADAAWPIEVEPPPPGQQRSDGPAPQRMALTKAFLQLPRVATPAGAVVGEAAVGSARFLSSQLAAWPRLAREEIPLPRALTEAVAQLPPLQRLPSLAQKQLRRRRKPVAPARCLSHKLKYKRYTLSTI